MNLVGRVGSLPLLVASALLFMSITPACVFASTVGVRLGDWWEYATSCNFSSNHPESPDPGEMMETVPAFYRVAVVDISDTAVVLEMAVGFRNGTQVKAQAAGDLATGTGNLTRPRGIGSFFLFPAGLSEGTGPGGRWCHMIKILGHINSVTTRSRPPTSMTPCPAPMLGRPERST